MHIIYSQEDPAGKGIIKELEKMIENGDSKIKKQNIISFSSSLLYSDQLVEGIKSDFVIFASKHKSESKKPSFTFHVPGNWGRAEMGGKDREISFNDPIRMKSIGMLLDEKNRRLGLDVTMEVTMEVDHHGPLCLSPCVFVEIGSTEKEWNNENYWKLIGEVINEYEDRISEIDVKEISVGVGGGHYCPAFNKYEIAGNIAFSHIIPSYAINDLKYETFVQAFERSTEEIDCVYIDWKGLKQEQRKKIIEFCNEYGIEYKRS